MPEVRGRWLGNFSDGSVHVRRPPAVEAEEGFSQRCFHAMGQLEEMTIMAEPPYDPEEFQRVMREVRALLNGKNGKLIASVGLTLCLNVIRANAPSGDVAKVNAIIDDMVRMLRTAASRIGTHVTLQ